MARKVPITACWSKIYAKRRVGYVKGHTVGRDDVRPWKSYLGFQGLSRPYRIGSIFPTPPAPPTSPGHDALFGAGTNVTR